MRYRQAKNRRAEGPEKKNILIIDDDEAIVSPIAEILRLEGYYVDTAKTGKEAIEKSKMRLCNLAIVDIKLPDTDGIQLLKSLKETIPRMVTIVFSGFRTKDSVTKALNSGAEAYFLKPLNMEKLLETLEEQLEKQQGARGLVVSRSSRKRLSSFPSSSRTHLAISRAIKVNLVK